MIIPYGLYAASDEDFSFCLIFEETINIIIIVI